MRKLLALLFCFAIGGTVAFALPGLSPQGPGLNRSIGGAPAYSGPGDLGITWHSYYGLRAFSNATTGAAVVNVCDATNTTCADFVTNSSGGLVTQTLNGENCGTSNTCTIRKWYDISGGNKCSGSTPCDTDNQTTASKRALLINSCQGGKVCARFAAASSQTYLITADYSVSITQPYTFVGAGKNTKATQADLWSNGNTAAQVGWAISSANDAWEYGGGGNIGTTTASGSTAHAVAWVLDDGSASLIYVDNSSSGTLPTIGGDGWPDTSSKYLCSGTDSGSYCTGDVYETGLFVGALSSGNVSLINTNQHSYWGF